MGQNFAPSQHHLEKTCIHTHGDYSSQKSTRIFHIFFSPTISILSIILTMPTPNMRMMWKAKTTSESKKLGSKAVGWNLAGSASTDLTRTRGRRALSELQAAQDIPTQLFTTPIHDNPTDTPSTLAGGDDPESVSKKRSVPEHTRATFEIAAVRSVLEARKTLPKVSKQA